MPTPTDSLSGQLIVLIGGDGYFGTHIAQELLARGARLRVVSRHPEKAFRLKPLGNLGALQTVRADVTRPGAAAALVAGADAVVNLAGAFTGDLEALHVRAAGALAAAAAAAGARAFVQVSANGADADSRVAYARTKAQGEAAVLAAFPRATVLRPSVIFGPDDQFINLFAGLIAKAPVLPVFGPEAKLQPVFVDDAAAAVAAALADPEAFGGQTFELVGPEVLTMFALNQRIACAQGRKTLFAPLPDAAAKLIAALPLTPISLDQLALLKAGNVSTGLPGLAELGIAARPLGLFLDRWMTRFRVHGRFGDKRGLAG
ncbi:NAD-dependent epimerase/dehydratase family protein [Novosphingobium piscinae]|uniref:NAD(P)H-binding protein n=1 Tax=Novosphingobium piscinae TaxID=1507448 RepID=A0A7X1FY46_9SPHN|nr:NAD-dependent epimerase/dehydratase family protein [Novosphingobium piscinae]MBC2669046.1 NAD(P)H-binding protein [Novosphingobium piscinae]